MYSGVRKWCHSRFNWSPNAFLLADLYLNSPLPCATLPRLDLSRWEAVQRPQVTSSSSKAEDREEEEILEAIR